MSWSELTPRERDAEIAQMVFRWSAADMRLLGDLRDVPHYTTDHAACRLVEDEIERQKLQAAFTIALGEVLGYTDQIHDRGAKELWEMVTATPEQRCEAAWRAMLDSKDSS